MSSKGASSTQYKTLPYLLTAVLEITHERLLDTIELGKLNTDGFARPLQVLRALREVLAAFDASGRDCKGSLRKKRVREWRSCEQRGIASK